MTRPRHGTSTGKPPRPPFPPHRGFSYQPAETSGKDYRFCPELHAFSRRCTQSGRQDSESLDKMDARKVLSGVPLRLYHAPPVEQISSIADLEDKSGYVAP